MKEIVTSNYANFGHREQKLQCDLWKAIAEQGCPIDSSNLHIEFNTHSGNVFFVNDDNQVAMLNGNTLERFFSCLECGNEGFAEDVMTKKGRCNQCHKKDSLL